MIKNSKSIDDMIDYVRQLRRHTDGRRAIHIRLSVLEKHFREEHYRRFVAANFRPLITSSAATMFAMPNADIVLLTKDTSVDVLDTHLANVRRKYKDSALVSSIDPVQGVSDVFVEWFDLEEDYQAFHDYADVLAAQLKEGLINPKKEAQQESVGTKRSLGMLELNSRPTERVKPAKRLKMVMVEAIKESGGPEKKLLDLDLLHSIWNALQSADIRAMVRKQNVMAIVGSYPPQPVMAERLVSHDAVFETLLNAEVDVSETWLAGYLGEFLSSRMLFVAPNMEGDVSIASSMKVSAASVCDDVFDKFDQNLNGMNRSSIILEFNILELLSNQTRYLVAREKIDRLGYKVSVCGIDPRVLLWMDYSALPSDFIKLKNPAEPGSMWLTSETEKQIKQRIQKIGIARVIWDGCHRDEDIELGKRLGITLFQGAAVDEPSSC